jgi:DNA-binding transcriptional LysR family regulator
MTLYQLKVFATVARLKNFSRAAEILHVRQPSVSLVIQGFQRELGVKLFERLGKNMHLTRAGDEVFSRAEEILARADEIKEAIDGIKRLKKGSLSLGGSATAGATFLPGAVQAFKQAHPGVDVTLTIQRSESLEKDLLEGKLDLAILGIPPRSDAIAVEAYRHDAIVLVASPDHPLAKKRSVSLEHVAGEPFIMHEKGTFIRDRVEERFAEKGFPLTVALEVNAHFGARETIKKAVASGLGLGCLSRAFVASEIQAGQLERLKVPEIEFKRIIYIAVHKNRKNSPFVHPFINFLRHYKD